MDKPCTAILPTYFNELKTLQLSMERHRHGHWNEEMNSTDAGVCSFIRYIKSNFHLGFQFNIDWCTLIMLRSRVNCMCLCVPLIVLILHLIERCAVELCCLSIFHRSNQKKPQFEHGFALNYEIFPPKSLIKKSRGGKKNKRWNLSCNIFHSRSNEWTD